jgi:hypothetical protein
MDWRCKPMTGAFIHGMVLKYLLGHLNIFTQKSLILLLKNEICER